MNRQPIRADRIPPIKPDYPFVAFPRDFLGLVWPEISRAERILWAYLWQAKDQESGIVPRHIHEMLRETGLRPRVFAEALRRLEVLELIVTALDGRVQMLWPFPERFRKAG